MHEGARGVEEKDGEVPLRWEPSCRCLLGPIHGPGLAVMTAEVQLRMLELGESGEGFLL